MVTLFLLLGGSDEGTEEVLFVNICPSSLRLDGRHEDLNYQLGMRPFSLSVMKVNVIVSSTTKEDPSGTVPS